MLNINECYNDQEKPPLIYFNQLEFTSLTRDLAYNMAAYGKYA